MSIIPYGTNSYLTKAKMVSEKIPKTSVFYKYIENIRLHIWHLTTDDRQLNDLDRDIWSFGVF